MHDVLLAHVDKTLNRRITVKTKFPPLIIKVDGRCYVKGSCLKDETFLRYVEADVYDHDQQAETAAA